jgi:hypothetical protein
MGHGSCVMDVASRGCGFIARTFWQWGQTKVWTCMHMCRVLSQKVKTKEAFPQSVVYYKRFIDDIFGIWVPPVDADDDASWQAFQARIQDHHGMEWTFSERSHSVPFMDLTLTIQHGRIHSSLYEKELNHHLYIPPHSAHPPGVTLGLIYGLAFRIITLCSDEADVLTKLRASFRHLIRRGYTSDILKPLFHRAIANARQYDGASPRQRAVDHRSILFKTAYHPQDPPSYALQRIWREEMSHPPSAPPLAQTISGHTKRPIGVERMIVCYRRPLNLGNLLSSRKFTFKNGPSVSSRLAGLET